MMSLFKFKRIRNKNRWRIRYIHDNMIFGFIVREYVFSMVKKERRRVQYWLVNLKGKKIKRFSTIDEAKDHVSKESLLGM